MYDCVRCGLFTGNDLDDICNHLRQTPICEANFSNVAPEILLKSYDIFYQIYLEDKNKTFEVFTASNGTKYYRSGVKGSYVYACFYCKNEYGRVDVCKRHTENQCKKNASIQVIVQPKDSVKVTINVSDTDDVTGITKNNAINYALLASLSSQNTPSIPGAIKTIISSYYDDISLSESITKIPIHMWYYILDIKTEAIKRVVKSVFFDIPENRHIYMTEPSSNVALVCNRETKWQEKEIWTIVFHILDVTIDLLDEHAERYVDHIGKGKMCAIKDITEDFCANPSQSVTTHINDIVGVLVCNNKLVDDTFMVSYGTSINNALALI